MCYGDLPNKAGKDVERGFVGFLSIRRCFASIEERRFPAQRISASSLDKARRRFGFRGMNNEVSFYFLR